MIKFEMHETLADEVLDCLRSQDINIDDWDYMLFVEEHFEHEFAMHQESRIMEPLSHEVEGLLHGSCSNIWYSLTDFMGRKGILGIAYHS